MNRTRSEAPKRARARIHDDDDDGSPSRSPRGKSSSSRRPQTPDELIAALTGIGFDCAAPFIIKYGYDRVLAALERGLSRPPGMIDNLPGYIHNLVTQRGPIPKPDRPAKKRNKYTSGKFGHLVKK